MDLLTEQPFSQFFEEIQGSTIKTLRAAMPFLSESVVNDCMIDFLAKRRTKLVLITNLSSLHIAMSLSNPAKPLLSLLEKLENRVEIRKAQVLHAKLLLADEWRGLAGSSNLTQGGDQTNWELNFILRRTKDDRTKIAELKDWFDSRLSQSIPVTKKDLVAIEKSWDTYEKLRRDIRPEVRLGGKYWKKLQQFAHRKEVKLDTAHKWLTEKDSEENKRKNTKNKLIFLHNLGIVSGWDADKVYIATQKPAFVDNRLMTAKQISYHVTEFNNLIQTMYEAKQATYEKLEALMNLEKGDEGLRAAVLWAESLEYIERDKASKPHVFLFKKQALEFLK